MNPTKLSLLSIALMYFLVYVPRFATFRAQAKLPGGMDNNHPRAQQAKLEGLGLRAQGAHLNGFEAFAPFAAGVLGCVFTNTRPGLVSMLALTFVGLRTVYIALYLGNIAPVRSLVWLGGFGITCTLLVLPVLG